MLCIVQPRHIVESTTSPGTPETIKIARSLLDAEFSVQPFVSNKSTYSCRVAVAFALVILEELNNSTDLSSSPIIGP
jgi:hypothetical protein